jgi:hypothetical protein
MSVMECAHGGDQPYRSLHTPLFAYGLAHLIDGLQYSHGVGLSSSLDGTQKKAGRAVALTRVWEANTVLKTPRKVYQKPSRGKAALFV